MDGNCYYIRGNCDGSCRRRREIMRKTLIFMGFMSLAGLPAILHVLSEELAMSDHPDGAGDPDATTCRRPQPIPNSRFTGPRVCKLNSQWALLRKNGQDLSADGRDIIPDAKGTNVGP